jgi:hypothetical protein
MPTYLPVLHWHAYTMSTNLPARKASGMRMLQQHALAPILVHDCPNKFKRLLRLATAALGRIDRLPCIPLGLYEGHALPFAHVISATLNW